MLQVKWDGWIVLQTCICRLLSIITLLYKASARRSITTPHTEYSPHSIEEMTVDGGQGGSPQQVFLSSSSAAGPRIFRSEMRLISPFFSLSLSLHKTDDCGLGSKVPPSASSHGRRDACCNCGTNLKHPYLPYFIFAD